MKRFILRFCAGLVPVFLCLTAQAQTYKSAASEPQFVLKAGQGTGKALTTPGSWGACVSAAEAAALKAATKKDSVFTCDVVHGNVPVKYTAIPDPKPDVTWVQCALERQAGGCQFTGSREVRFGTSPTISGQYAAKTVTGPVECTNAVFGDPVVGVEKKCWTTGTLIPPVVTPPPVEPPTTPPVTPPSIGGVPKPSDFTGLPVVGRIVATNGQVISRVRVTTSSGDCIVIPSGVTGVVIRDAEIGPCGGGNAAYGKGVDVQSGATNLTVTKNWIHNVSTGLYADGGINPIDFMNNLVENIAGPFPRGQMVQFNGVKGGPRGSKITCNVSDGTTSVHNIEDHINSYASAGPSASQPNEIAYNRLRGGSPTSDSGSGIMTGDGGGGNTWVHHNTVVNVRNVGIGVAGGTSVLVENNRIFMDGRNNALDVNIGTFIWRTGDQNAACSNHIMRNNRAWVWSSREGRLNHYWNGGGCTNVVADSNSWGDTSLTAAIFNEVPTQCQ